ncbi:CHAT domain-containing protein [Couchioplanes caeruleus]|uniref:CHAT domain-containing protein n=1 Tax=Couchioplanes caeruleus TaxID=56438 RepID=UPI0020C00ED4|nr:CHAT domain-containing protein [Couchioplanes caeruleus]UQU64900.1 CHAT domain-containing protein [Couchioplanes caeruleus]
MTRKISSVRGIDATLSVFVHPFAFRAITAARSAVDDLIALAVLTLAGICWTRAFNRYEIPAALVRRLGGDARWAAESGAWRYLPLLVAAFAYVAVRRVGRGPARTPAHADWSDAVVPMLVRAACVVGSGWYLAGIPGTVPGRYGPLLLAVVTAHRLHCRDTRAHRQHRRPTVAGYRPALRASLRPRGWVALRNCALGDVGIPGVATNMSQQWFDEAIALFRASDDVVSAAYCTARAIEFELRNGALVEAGRRSRTAMDDPVLRQESAVLSARAQFLRVIGDHAGALRLLNEALARPRGRTADLTSLIIEIAFDPDARDGETPTAFQGSDRQRAAAVWRGKPAAALLSLVAEARAVAASAEPDAIGLAYAVVGLSQRLPGTLPTGRISVTEVLRMSQAAGHALVVAGHLFENRQRPADAASAFLEAHDLLMDIGDRRRATRSLVRGFANAVASGYSEPRQENHALDIIRAGLHALEEYRVTLPEEASRAQWVQADHRLHARVFTLLTTGVRSNPAKAGELGVWLIESVHRTAASALISGDVVPTIAQLQADITALAEIEQQMRVAPDAVEDIGMELRKAAGKTRTAVADTLVMLRESVVMLAVDYDTILRRVGHRVALLYHCFRDEFGWVFHTALMSPVSGVTLHRSRIDQDPDGRDKAAFLSPVGILDAMAEADPSPLKWIYGALPLDADCWRDIARAVFPPGLTEVLRDTSRSGSVVELLIVPDGPIAGLPLSGLPVRVAGDRVEVLAEHAAVAFVPALSMLSEARPAKDPYRPRVAVVHLDDELDATAAERRQWESLREAMTVRSCADLAELREALDAEPRPDAAVISVHGAGSSTGLDQALRLRDGSVVTAASALGLRWPPTVVLGACWINSMAVRSGQESTGFSMACLMRGASTVIGGIAPVADTNAASVLAPVLAGLPVGASLVSATQQGVLAELRRTGRRVPAALWASFAVWTTVAGPALQEVHGPTHWGLDGLPATDVPVGARLALRLPVEPALSRRLRSVRTPTDHTPLGTLQTLLAVLDGDPGTWGSLGQAGLGPVPPDLLGREASQGTVTLTIDETDVLISADLAATLRRADALSEHLGHELIRPETLLLALVFDDNEAEQWLRNYAADGSDLLNRIAEVAIGPQHTDLRGIARVLHGRTADFYEDLHGTMVDAGVEKAAPLDETYLPWMRWSAIAVAAMTILYMGRPVLEIGQALGRPPRPTESRVPEPPRASIGVTLADRPAGVVVTAVTPGGAADRAGVLPGDVIVSAAGGAVMHATDVVELLREWPPGIELKLDIARESRPVMVRVQTWPYPAPNPTARPTS